MDVISYKTKGVADPERLLCTILSHLRSKDRSLATPERALLLH